METYYQVTYKTEMGVVVKYRRDTIERGYYLYKSLVKDFTEDGIYDCSIKLEEISDNGIALLRAKGEYKPKEIKAEKGEYKPKETKAEKEWQPKNWVEMLCGMPIEEYNECIDRWNSLTGEKNEHLSI